jgi:hypothetical protein
LLYRIGGPERYRTWLTLAAKNRRPLNYDNTWFDTEVHPPKLLAHVLKLLGSSSLTKHTQKDQVCMLQRILEQSTESAGLFNAISSPMLRHMKVALNFPTFSSRRRPRIEAGTCFSPQRARRKRI